MPNPGNTESLSKIDVFGTSVFPGATPSDPSDMSVAAQWDWLRAQNGQDSLINAADGVYGAATAPSYGGAVNLQLAGTDAAAMVSGGPAGLSGNGGGDASMPISIGGAGSAASAIVGLQSPVASGSDAFGVQPVAMDADANAPLSDLVAAAGNVTINLELDTAAQGAPANVKAAWQQAATEIAAAMNVPRAVTFNITIQYNENGIGSGAAEGGPSSGQFESYKTVRSDLIANAPAGDPNFNSLPNTSSIQGQSQVAVWDAQLKVFGILAGNGSEIDGSCDFSNAIASNLLVGVDLHEFAHALGRVPYGPPDAPQPDIFDLFRFTSPGTYLFDDHLPAAAAAYFSLDGGNTKLADYGLHSDPSDFLNAYAVDGDPASPLSPEDPFDQFYDSNTIQSLTSLDLKQLDVLGLYTQGAVSPGSVSIGNASITQGSSGTELMTFTVTRTGGSGAFSVNYATADGTATTGDDYTAANNTLSFGSSDTAKTVSITILGESTREPNESFTVNLSNPTNGATIANGVGTGTIVDGNHLPLIFGIGNFGTSAGGWTSQDAYPRALGDVNGDGKADIVGFGSNGAFVSLANGNGTFAAPILGSAAFGVDNGWTSNNLYPREMADVNGDGKADIVGFGSDGVYVALSNGNGTFGSAFSASPYFGANSGWTSQNQYPRELADVTGNGREDIVAFASDGVYVSLANPDGTFAAPILASTAFGTDNGWTSQDIYPRELADVTGNGRADIVGFGSDGVYVALSNGDGTFAAPFLATAAFGTDNGWISNDTYPRELADVTGNGRADIVGFGSDGGYVALANSDGTFQSPTFDFGDLGNDTAAGGWTSQNLYPRLLGDVTGDHKADIVAFASDGTYVADATVAFVPSTT